MKIASKQCPCYWNVVKMLFCAKPPQKCVWFYREPLGKRIYIIKLFFSFFFSFFIIPEGKFKLNSTLLWFLGVKWFLIEFSFFVSLSSLLSIFFYFFTPLIYFYSMFVQMLSEKVRRVNYQRCNILKFTNNSWVGTDDLQYKQSTFYPPLYPAA